MRKNADEVPSLIIGGPFWRLQQRLRLLDPDRLPSISTAVLYASLAWLPAALLSAAQGTAWNETLGGRAFLLDFIAYARLILAIFMLVIMERIAEHRSAALFRQFVVAGLVSPEDRPRFRHALQRADRRTSSGVAETVILVLAVVASTVGLLTQLIELRESWIGSWVDGRMQISWAGWWALLVGTPLFWFLALRWFWRFIVLTRLLWDIANLNLRLVATHPDRCGGIGFLGLYPSVYAILVLALSCVTASGALEALLFADWPLMLLAAPFLMWVALVLIIFYGPLVAFTPTLLQLKRRALRAYSKFASEHHLEFERKWIRSRVNGKTALGTTDISTLTDLSTAVQSINAMRPIPISLESLVPMLIAIGLPWLLVLATQIPIEELMKMIAKALL